MPSIAIVGSASGRILLVVSPPQTCRICGRYCAILINCEGATTCAACAPKGEEVES